MSDATQGYNTLVEVSIDDGTTWHEVAKCKQTDVFDSSYGKADVTHMRSPKKHVQQQTTIRSTNDLNLNVIYDKDDPTHAKGSTYGLRYLHRHDIKCRTRYTLSSGEEFIYSGKFSQFKIDAVSAESIVMASTTFMPMEAMLNEDD